MVAPGVVQAAPGGLSLLADDGHVRPLAEVELEVIRHAIDRYDNQMSEIARRLDIGRSTLYRKLKEIEDADAATEAAD